MSKPMLVTVPFVLLLLDYWPLRRMQKAKAEIRIPKSEIRRKPEIRTPKSELQSRITFHVSRFTFHVSRPTFHAPRFTFHVSRSLLLEKTPFFLLSAASCLVTCLAQVRGGAVETLERVPLGARLANAAVGYLGYLEKTVWPAKLSILYLRPPHWPLGRIGLAILVLTGISLLVLRLGRGRGWLSVGWLWFLGMLVPVSGIMQAGNQYMADRYSYLPLIGLFIIVAWAVGGNPKAEIRDPKEVRNPKSESAPAKAFHVSPHTLHVSRFTFHTLRSTLLTLVLACLAALAVHQSGFWRNSETLFGHCLAVTSDNYVAHNNLGAALAQQGRMAEARTNFMAAWHIQPHDADTLFNVGVLLTQEGKFGEAAPLLAEAAGIKPELGAKYGKLALVLEAQGHTDQAIACYREGLRLRPGQMETANNLAWILATTPDVKLRDGSEAVRLAQQACEWSGYQQPVVVGTLAAAYAEAGRFPEAVATAERAIALATAAGQPALVERNRQLLDLYRAGKPCRSR
jgi:Flp pilus assembly protein TadD